MASLLLAPSVASGQGQEPSTSGAEALRVFLDCGRCDFDYLRREVTFVNYVRDRPDAQVHVLVTRENTGGGGTAVTLDFMGLAEFEGIEDQLVYYTSQNDTDDDERRQLAQSLRLGLVRYAAQTALGQELEVSFGSGPLGQRPANAQPTDDPWNFWVFRTRFRVELESEERENTKRFSGSFSANRTTDMWKMNIGINSNYREDTFELTDSTFTNVRRDNALTTRVIKSLGDHMGFGFGGSALSSSFRNQDLSLRVAPAIEYNFFPYSESTRRQFTLKLFGRLQLIRLRRSHPVRRDRRAAPRPHRPNLVRRQRALGNERTLARVVSVSRRTESESARLLWRARDQVVSRLLPEYRGRELIDQADLPPAS